MNPSNRKSLRTGALDRRPASPRIASSASASTRAQEAAQFLVDLSEANDGRSGG
jgi:hypothetical protein